MDSINENQEPDLGNKALDSSDDENEPIKEFTVNLDVNGLPESTRELDEWRIKLLKNYGAKLRTDWEGTHQLSGSVTAVSNAREFLQSGGKINPRRDQNKVKQPSGTPNYGFENGTDLSFKTKSQLGTEKQFMDAEREQPRKTQKAKREELTGVALERKNDQGMFKARKEDRQKVQPKGQTEYKTGDGTEGKPDGMIEEKNISAELKEDDQSQPRKPKKYGTEDIRRLDDEGSTSIGKDNKGARPKYTSTADHYSQGALPGNTEGENREDSVIDNDDIPLKFYEKEQDIKKNYLSEGNLTTAQPETSAKIVSPIRKEFVESPFQNKQVNSEKSDAEIPIDIQSKQVSVPTPAHEEVIIEEILDCGYIEWKVVEHLWLDKIKNLHTAENRYNVEMSVSHLSPRLLVMKGTKSEIQKLKNKFEKWVRSVKTEVVDVSTKTPPEVIKWAKKIVSEEMSLNVYIRVALRKGKIEIFAVNNEIAQIAKQTLLEKLGVYCDRQRWSSIGVNNWYPSLEELKQSGEKDNVVPSQHEIQNLSEIRANSQRNSEVMSGGHQPLDAHESGMYSPEDGANGYTNSAAETMYSGPAHNTRSRDRLGDAQTLETVIMKNGLKVNICLGDITKMNLDVIVSSSNVQLKMTKGVAFAIAAAAGPGFVSECEQLMKDKKELEHGQVYPTSGGELRCKEVYHAVGPVSWEKCTDKNDAIQTLIQTIFICLGMANQSGYKTIAIPPIGSGVSKFPNPVVAKAVYEAADHFDESIDQVFSLKEVTYVTVDHQAAVEIANCFKKAGDIKLAQFGIDLGSKPTEHKKWNWVNRMKGRFKGDKENICPICLMPVYKKKKLEKCKHKFCEKCINDKFEKFGMICPVEGCNAVYGPLKGIMLDKATMYFYEDKTLFLPGFDKCPTYKISYDIPKGKQKVGHPLPGAPYKTAKYIAYIPACKAGKNLIKLLQKAFDAGLVFQIVAINGEFTPFWAGIPHKTNKEGGAKNFGYPDDNYLKKLKQELEAHGFW